MLSLFSKGATLSQALIEVRCEQLRNSLVHLYSYCTNNHRWILRGREIYDYVLRGLEEEQSQLCYQSQVKPRSSKVKTINWVWDLCSENVDLWVIFIVLWSAWVCGSAASSSRRLLMHVAFIFRPWGQRRLVVTRGEQVYKGV